MPRKVCDTGRYALRIRERQTALAVCFDAKAGDTAVFQPEQFTVRNRGIEQRQAFEVPVHARERVHCCSIVRAVGAAGDDDRALQTQSAVHLQVISECRMRIGIIVSLREEWVGVEASINMEMRITAAGRRAELGLFWLRLGALNWTT